ncbi:MAG TPA: CAP domain-containing protein [Candidatus Limnocylindria bacterium]|nr:CAP domain-containing protein [Candidatus Limnocylindria bacterium]
MHLPTALPVSLGIPPRLLTSALAGVFVAASLSAAAAAPVQASSRGDGLRAEANERRAAADLAPVQGTDLLDSIAAARADQMRDANKMEHDMDYIKQRFQRADTCWASFGEIIAWRSAGEYSYAGTITQWMNSKPHRDIMLGPTFNAAGGSWATASDGGHYSVMIFATLCSSELSRLALLRPAKEYSPDRPMVLAAGRHTAYRLSSTGAVLGSKRLDLDRRAHPEATGRSRVNGVAYLKVSSGPLAGYWVRESHNAFVRGVTQLRNFASERQLSVAAGTYVAKQFNGRGAVTAERAATLDRGYRTKASAWAIINGRAWYLISHGMWDGYWLRDGDAVAPVE